jgi:hypothetical protein
MAQEIVTTRIERRGMPASCLHTWEAAPMISPRAMILVAVLGAIAGATWGLLFL